MSSEFEMAEKLPDSNTHLMAGETNYYIMAGAITEGGVPLDEGPFKSPEAAGARCKELVAERKARGLRSKFTVFSAAVVHFAEPQEVCLAAP